MRRCTCSNHGKPRAFNVGSREQCCELFGSQSPRLLPGVGPKTAQTLDALGLTTIEQLRTCSNALLAQAFGDRRASELQACARFEHDGVVQREREPKSKSEETTFDRDVEDLPELEQRMRSLATELCERLRTRELRGRTIAIKVRLADFTTVTRAHTIDEHTDDEHVVARVACELLHEYDPSQPVRLIGVRVAAFDRARADASTCEEGPGAQLRIPRLGAY